MEREEIIEKVELQRAYYKNNAPFSYEERINNLNKLYSALEKFTPELREALKKDLGKSETEADMCEIRLTLSEITYLKKHLKKWMKDKKVHTPIAQFYSSSFIRPLSYGTVLIMSPWNYPVLLSLEPLADALSAGNTVILKPSLYSYHTTLVLKRLISSIFPPELVYVVDGGREENKALLDIKFDYIFFTGSKAVGKYVMNKASNFLTPVTLELGGKSPTIVTKNASLDVSAKRIVFGKLINSGQTCVAPDYILVEESIKEDFLSLLIEEIKKQDSDRGKIINEKHFARIQALIDKDKVVYGGKCEPSTLIIEPTVMVDIKEDDKVMQEEIFGPIFPIITYTSINEAISFINEREKPLALYVFTEDKKEAKRIMTKTLFGGGCINDTVIHLATSEMGFGGVGESGMGSYHGKNGFDTFSHYTSIVDKKTNIDLPMRYRPYSKKKQRLINFFLK